MSHYTGSVPALEPAGQWVKQAACADRGDEMFPDNSEHGIEAAKRICRRCPVRTECLRDAIRTDDNWYGIRAGLRPNERRAVAKELERRQAEAGQQPVVEEPPAPEPRPERTFQTLWDERTQPLPDGHMGWNGPLSVYFQGRYYTPWQIAFRVDRDRPPVGLVRRTCDVDGCVLPAHLMDQQERNKRNLCGTDAGYQQHRKNGEECDVCRQAHTAEDRRMRHARTAKAAA